MILCHKIFHGHIWLVLVLKVAGFIFWMVMQHMCYGSESYFDRQPLCGLDVEEYLHSSTDYPHSNVNRWWLNVIGKVRLFKLNAIAELWSLISSIQIVSWTLQLPQCLQPREKLIDIYTGKLTLLGFCWHIQIESPPICKLYWLFGLGSKYVTELLMGGPKFEH